MPEQIDSFRGKYRFLSNFHPCEMVAEWDQGFAKVPTLEHAFQAAKAVRREDFEAICQAKTAGAAKRIGKELKAAGRVRPDWYSVNLKVMEDLLRQKFSNPELRKKLVETGNAELVEGNDWGDVFFGVCRGKGENHLGRLLMKIRKDLLWPNAGTR